MAALACTEITKLFIKWTGLCQEPGQSLGRLSGTARLTQDECIQTVRVMIGGRGGVLRAHRMSTIPSKRGLFQHNRHAPSNDAQSNLPDGTVKSQLPFFLSWQRFRRVGMKHFFQEKQCLFQHKNAEAYVCVCVCAPEWTGGQGMDGTQCDS